MDYQSEPVVITPIGEGLRVAVHGPIHTNTAWIEGEFNRVIAAKPKRVELDLRSTNYVSSMGLGVLLSFRKRLAGIGAVLKVVAIQRQVLNVFRYARLEQVFEIDQSVVLTAP